MKPSEWRPSQMEVIESAKSALPDVWVGFHKGRYWSRPSKRGQWWRGFPDRQSAEQDAATRAGWFST